MDIKHIYQAKLIALNHILDEINRMIDFYQKKLDETMDIKHE